MRREIRSNVILNIVWIALASVLYLIAIPYGKVKSLDPIGPNVFPQIISAVVVICAIANLITIYWNRNKDKTSKAGEETSNVSASYFMEVLAVIATSGLYIIVMPRVGYLISTVVLVFLLILIQKGIELKKNLLISCAFSLILYLLFSKVLNILLPQGFFTLL